MQKLENPSPDVSDPAYSRPSVRLYMAVLTAMGGYIVAYAGIYAMYERLSY